MDWTEREENALLEYLRDKQNNKRFWKRNAERDKAFKDCAFFVSRQSERRRHFDAEDAKNFCLYLVKDRYKLNQSNLSHLFHVGIFFHREDGTCDIFTRDECSKLSEEDEAREEGRLIPEETSELPLRTFDSVTRRGARYKSGSSETDNGKSSSTNARKRQKSTHTKSVDECQSLSVPKERESIPSLPEGSNHLVYKHRHMDGAEIPRKFAQLEKDIMIAADSLSSRDNSEVSLNRPQRYGKDDSRLLKSVPIAGVIQRWDSSVHFQVARALVGLCVFEWVFEGQFADTEMYSYPSKEAVDAIWTIRCEQYGMRMLHPSYAILKDAYFWQTTQTRFLTRSLPKRSQELSAHLTTLLGTLFKTEVPLCSTEHKSEHARLKDCNSWSCQIEAVFLDALDLCVKLRQRDHKTVFRWPAIDDRFNEAFMRDESADQKSSPRVKFTYMPAVIDQHDSDDPSAVDGGVWYRAVVSLASAAEIEQVPASTSGS